MTSVKKGAIYYDISSVEIEKFILVLLAVFHFGRRRILVKLFTYEVLSTPFAFVVRVRTLPKNSSSLYFH